MGLVWDLYPEGGGELLTMLKLADHAEHDGSRVWPSIRLTAAMTRQSERTVQRQIAAIMKNGWLEVVEQGGKGPADTTRYRIPVDRITQGIGVRVTNCHPYKLSTRVTPEVNKGDIHDKKGDIAVSPESSLKATVIKSTHQGARQKQPRRPFRGKQDQVKTWQPKDDDHAEQ